MKKTLTKKLTSHILENTNKMSDWNERDDKDKKAVDRRFISCNQEHEINDIIDYISEKYPKWEKEQIKEATNLCCESVTPPRPRTNFLLCVINKMLNN